MRLLVLCLSVCLSVCLYFPPSVSGRPCGIFRLPPQRLAWIFILEIFINMYEHIRNLGKARQMTDPLHKNLCTYMITFVTDVVMYNLITNILMLVVINFLLNYFWLLNLPSNFFVATLSKRPCLPLFLWLSLLLLLFHHHLIHRNCLMLLCLPLLFFYYFYLA